MKLLADLIKTGRVIINADDFGMNSEASKGIALAVKNRWVNSISVCMTQLEFLADLKAELSILGDVDVGLHISLTEGKPVSETRRLGTMLTGTGHFRPAQETLGSETLLDADAIFHEIQAQVVRFHSLTGKMPKHLDCHQYFAYLSPRAFQALLMASRAIGTPIRSPKPFIDRVRLEAFSKRVEVHYGIRLPFRPATRASELHALFIDSQPLVRSNEVLIDLDFVGSAEQHVSQQLAMVVEEAVEIVCHPRLVQGLEGNRLSL